MAAILTPKQEKFCMVYLETGNASEAYRQSYDASKSSEPAINVNAKKLLDNAKIALRIEELRKPIMKRHNLTIDTILAELEEARQLAFQTDKAAAAVSASMGKAKLLGMDKQIIEHTSPDGTMTPKSAITLNQTDIKNILTKINEGI